MRQAKNPTRRQKLFIQKWHMNPGDWLVIKDSPERMVLRHRHFDSKIKILPKRRETE